MRPVNPGRSSSLTFFIPSLPAGVTKPAAGMKKAFCHTYPAAAWQKAAAGPR